MALLHNSGVESGSKASAAAAHVVSCWMLVEAQEKSFLSLPANPSTGSLIPTPNKAESKPKSFGDKKEKKGGNRVQTSNLSKVKRKKLRDC